MRGMQRGGWGWFSMMLVGAVISWMVAFLLVLYLVFGGFAILNGGAIRSDGTVAPTWLTLWLPITCMIVFGALGFVFFSKR